MKKRIISTVAIALASALVTTQASAAIDEAAAKAIAKKSDCTKCHAVDKSKKGPSYKKIALKYKGKTEGVAALIKNITTGPKIKLEDGTEDTHKIIDTKDQAEIRNLVDWILSQ